MERPGWQLGVVGLMVIVACVAVNLWLFRFGIIAGLVGGRSRVSPPRFEKVVAFGQA